MKKYLLVLPFLTFSLAAMAQDKLEAIPQSIINAAVKRFETPFCNKPVKKQMQVVYQCYQNTKASDPKYTECYLGDILLNGIIYNEHIKTKPKPDYDANIPPFFREIAKNQRALDLTNLLISKGYNEQEQRNYILQGFKQFNARMTALCNQ